MGAISPPTAKSAIYFKNIQFLNLGVNLLYIYEEI